MARLRGKINTDGQKKCHCQKWQQLSFKFVF